ncbi:MAG: cation:proton antiporter [Planctomycetota bacterium]|nr:cation:proton antiporter [Planctomycetota bacterium]
MPPAATILAENVHMPIILIIGLAVLFGTIGARLFQRLHIPQVVGYIMIGLIVGRSGLGLIGEQALESLTPFNFFALGVIGFMIGGELRREVFRKYGRQFIEILFSEGIGAFVVVSILTGGIAMLITRDVAVSVAMGIILGALSTATAPAATVNVLWEYKTRGVLTTAIYAVVAMDDALALVLFSIAASVAAQLTGLGDGGGLFAALGRSAYELGGGAVLGAAAGIGLNFILRRVRDRGNSLTFIIGALAIVVGAGKWLSVDVILAAMTLGATVANLAPRRSRMAFEVVERFAAPLYVLFFVVVGAHLGLREMPGWIWALTLPYLLARSVGKILGANLGARLAKAPEVLRKYLGLCLFCQGGVAVGLSIMAGSRFPGEIGLAIIMIITVTTLIAEILGPPCVKFAVRRAGEVGLNVTEQDLLQSYKVGDVMDRSSPSFSEGATLGEILHTIAETGAMSYPVTDAAGELTGVITLQDLKQGFSTEGLSEWLLADDLKQPVVDTITEGELLAEAVTRMQEQDLECLPVVTGGENLRLVGLLELRAVNRMLSQEIIRRREQADGVPG